MSIDLESDIGRHAIECYGICKHYGRRKSKLQVLNKLTMKVPRGKIYGLLGPSGCGKTTLLRCVLGRLSFDSGLVLALGRPPLTRGHGIPGNRVGYMPQELALYNDFTIKETLVYYSTIHRMSHKDTCIRIDFLIDLLHLPEKSRIVGNLSGGQKRRVSFAIALIQSPELLILDEPTVGVDPLLRKKIWEYLYNFSRESHTTIILTTHYIEEARNADIVGLMRNGKILSENTPTVLQDKYQLPTLEDIFLKLCMEDSGEEDEERKGRTVTEKTNLLHASGSGSYPSYTNPTYDKPSTTPNGHVRLPQLDDTQCVVEYDYDKPKWKWYDLLPSLTSLWALIFKDLVKFGRNPGLTAFFFIIPIMEASFFFLAIGAPPKNLPVAVVNYEVPAMLSQSFLNQLNNETIIQKPVDTMEQALDNIQDGAYWGIIQIPANYSAYSLKRLATGGVVDNETLTGSTIAVTLDATNQQIAASIQSEILNAYDSFIQATLTEFGINPALGQMPVVFVEPIYGTLGSSFTQFMAAGFMVTVIFFLTVGMTSMTFVVERKEGLMDRIWVAGVSTLEVTIAHISTHLLVALIQIALVMIVAFAVFKIENEGSYMLIVLMLVLQGLCGMCIGLLVSSICDTESGALQASLGTFYPILMLSGLIWPIEAIPYPLYYVSIALPQTYAGETMRSIMGRGWGMEHSQVWMGYVVTTVWWVVPLALSALILRIKR